MLWPQWQCGSTTSYRATENISRPSNGSRSHQRTSPTWRTYRTTRVSACFLIYPLPYSSISLPSSHPPTSFNFLQGANIKGVLSPQQPCLQGDVGEASNSSVANMTVRELKSAETKDNYKVVSVWDHKTATAHGSARIVMPERMYQLILGESPGGDRSPALSPTALPPRGRERGRGLRPPTAPGRERMYLHVKYCTV